MEGFLVLVFYLVIGIFTVTFGVLLYLRSSLSRKKYRCPKCNEVVNVELMDATRCNVCGAPLRNPKKTYEDDDYYGTAP